MANEVLSMKNHPPLAGSMYHDMSASTDSTARPSAMFRSRALRSAVFIFASLSCLRIGEVIRERQTRLSCERTSRLHRKMERRSIQGSTVNFCSDLRVLVACCSKGGAQWLCGGSRRKVKACESSHVGNRLGLDRLCVMGQEKCLLKMLYWVRPRIRFCRASSSNWPAHRP